MPGDSVTNLAIRVLAGLIFVGFSAWMLSRADREAERLFKLKKLYGLTKKDDATEIKKTKIGVLLGYSFFLVLMVMVTIFFGIQLWKRL